MAIDRETVLKIAGLANIALSEEEVGRFERDLSKIDAFVSRLAGLDTEGVAPATHTLELKSVYRDDDVAPSLTREEALANAPVHGESGLYITKRGLSANAGDQC